MNQRDMPDNEQPIRLLHLEDSARDAELIQRKLEAGGLACDILRVSNRKQFEAALAQAAFHVILCDYNLPDYDGVSALKLARQKRADVPVILLSGSLSEEEAVKCLHLGATDYLPKQRLERLVPAINRALREAEEHRRREQSEADLRESEERFRLLAEHSSEVFWFFTPNPSRVVYISPSVENIWGLPVAQFYRDPDAWWKAIHPGDQPRVRAAWEEFTGGESLRFEEEYRIIQPNGSIHWVLGSGTAIHNEVGDVVRLGGLARDITGRKQLEAQFLQAQKMESVGQLASGIAHDFNNLLTVIISACEFARMSLREDDPVREELDEIRAAGARAAALTRQLLAFSRKQILQPATLNLNDIVINMESMLRRVIGEHIELSMTLAEDLVSVKVDPGQIEQVILNLALNSRDAMPKGGKLTFETRNVGDAKATAHVSGQLELHAMLAISDTGTGMDEATRLKMFEPFFTTKDPGKGTGLGMSTVYGIVKQSAGDISVISEIGRGTTIKITLPRGQEPAPAPRLTPTSTVAVPAARVTRTILVVDDDESIRRVVRRILEGAGYAVLMAATGADALLLLERADGPIHLMLTDMVMPGMSGRELAERIGSSHPETKILFTSGYTDDAVVHNDVFDDGVHFIGKPYTVPSLTRKVREALDL